MGDRTTVRLEIGGTIYNDTWLELLELLADNHAMDNDHWDPVRADKPPTLSPGGTICVYFEECNYGEIPEVTDWLDEREIPYTHSWEAGGGYGPGCRIEIPGQPSISFATVEYDPALPVYQIEQLLQDGKLEEHLALIRQKIPTLKVIA